MSRVCQITGKGPMTGNRVSHANNKRRRRFLPNLHVQRFWLETERRFVSLRVSTRGLRTIEKKGIEKVVAELRAEGIDVVERVPHQIAPNPHNQGYLDTKRDRTGHQL